MSTAKWIFFLLFTINTVYAFSIATKNSINGFLIHSTSFITPNNQPVSVQAKVFVGNYVNGYCQIARSYDIGNDALQTGDFINVDALKLESLVGGGYSCMSIFYTGKQTVWETFQLIYDGVNYNTSNPPSTQVTISMLDRMLVF